MGIKEKEIELETLKREIAQAEASLEQDFIKYMVDKTNEKVEDLFFSNKPEFYRFVFTEQNNYLREKLTDKVGRAMDLSDEIQRDKTENESLENGTKFKKRFVFELQNDLIFLRTKRNTYSAKTEHENFQERLLAAKDTFRLIKANDFKTKIYPYQITLRLKTKHIIVFRWLKKEIIKRFVKKDLFTETLSIKITDKKGQKYALIANYNHASDIIELMLDDKTYTTTLYYQKPLFDLIKNSNFNLTIKDNTLEINQAKKRLFV
ncbi:hypothetical protein SE88_05525 [Helicobacter pylori]|jgi:hypothetical protein|uniref:Uncharacterized protein n=2 Tax=Helicobacter pylori TaxID=210 RepID=O25707_HELPY|nr:predicted coding region HP1074 [Helicobacter pylori 26695]AFV43881.1 hypothetical protein C695_05555 [Helicobacter pylori Rif1]AFV45473.1 hypothetical protein C730_05550 [Helicobacter pylori Rif2]AJF09306.1 hypothetical protein SE87_05525 [Helicobacter pylori 26695-1]AJF10847.1 hypothetical protein SE88_05525 [Helicobacter pylori]